MDSRLALSVRAFYAGLVIMLVAGVGWSVLQDVGTLLLPGLMLVGALLAVGAKLWNCRLQRASRRRDVHEGLGGYPMQVLRDPRFMSRRRSVA